MSLIRLCSIALPLLLLLLVPGVQRCAGHDDDDTADDDDSAGDDDDSAGDDDDSAGDDDDEPAGDDDDDDDLVVGGVDNPQCGCQAGAPTADLSLLALLFTLTLVRRRLRRPLGLI